MSRSAIRWAALNLLCAERPGLRRKILCRWIEESRPKPLDAGWSPFDGKIGAILERGWMAQAGEEMERARRFGARILTLEDEAYPPLLRASSDPPPLLYVWGQLRPEDLLAVAVVGSRRATPRGIDLARRIGADLAARGFCVVSGLARGIDAAGHRGALEGSGRTVAVLGSGLDRIYPREHQKLAESIALRGAVVSEFPFGTPPLRRHFPERNRVIAWLSWTTIVIEAARDSGSLITAGLAIDEGRSVHAVPGPVGAPASEGTNTLLRDGALVCRGADDVVEDLAPQVTEAADRLRAARTGQTDGAPDSREVNDAGGRKVADRTALTTAQRRILKCLDGRDVLSIERLGEICGLAPGSLLADLLVLELQGLVRQLPGRLFASSGCKI